MSTAVAIRTSIQKLEESILAHPEKLELTHIDHFSHGLYGRELLIPKDVIITSKLHKQDHFLFIMQGKGKFIDEFGGKTLVEAPCLIYTRAGTKRAIHALEDLIMITVHATTETDVAEIEKQVLADSYEDLGDIL